MSVDKLFSDICEVVTFNGLAGFGWYFCILKNLLNFVLNCCVSSDLKFGQVVEDCFSLLSVSAVPGFVSHGGLNGFWQLFQLLTTYM